MTRSAFKTNLCFLLGFAVVILLTIVYALWTSYTAVRVERNYLRDRNYEAFSESDALDATKARAQRIIEALMAYADDNERYPRFLDDLAPKYLKEIPHPLAGDPKWEYGTLAGSNDQEFVLAFGINEYGDVYPCEYYSSSGGEWHSDN